MLYLCATPIGNIEDITIRAINTLKEVDIIYAEDTRYTKRLLNHYNIRKPVISYYKYNEKKRAQEGLKHLKAGKNIAIVTNAGTCSLADPGFELIRLAIENDIPITSIPGASAVTAAVTISGIKPYPFVFFGYLPRYKSDRIKFLQEIKDRNETMVFFESPHRLLKTLDDMVEIFGDRKIAICRELTKKFEEVIRGEVKTVREILNRRDKIKGEITIVMEGRHANLRI